MNGSLAISKTGLQGLQKNLDVVAHNIANANTDGFKQNQVSFNELLLNDFSPTQVNLSDNLDNGTISRGTRAEVTGFDNRQGSFYETGNGTDLAISDEGFFAIRTEGNQLRLTRNGNFSFNEDRILVNNQGQNVEVNYTVPREQWPDGKESITRDGSILVNGQRVGQMVLYRPTNSALLIETGSNQFRVENEGALLNSLTTPAGFGQLHSGYLESSNVDLANSMSELIVTQRAYSLNSRVLQATDEMMQRVNDFK